MDLKVKYHYTHFIYPFIINHKKYKEFVGKLAANQKEWSFKINEKEADAEEYTFFLPYVNKFLLPTLYWDSEFKKEFKNMSIKKKVDIINDLTSATFEYNINEICTTHGTLKDGNPIIFDISQIRLLCFEPGICFLDIKTEIDEDTEYTDFSKILDFNYKFRMINEVTFNRQNGHIEIEGLKFPNVENISEFINKLLKGFENISMETIYYDRLFTYSYACLDKTEWNNELNVDRLMGEFHKFHYVLQSSQSSLLNPNFEGIKENTYNRWTYSIYGFSRESGVVLTTEQESFNITRLPEYFENLYFYVMILAFYQRISLIVFSQELLTNDKDKIEKLKQRLTRFTHFSWFSQITNSEHGMDLWEKWQNAFELAKLYEEVQKEYKEFFDYITIKGQDRLNTLLVIVFTVTMIFGGLTLVNDLYKLETHWFKVIVMVILIGTTALYPIYVLLHNIKKTLKKMKKTI